MSYWQSIWTKYQYHAEALDQWLTFLQMPQRNEGETDEQLRQRIHKQLFPEWYLKSRVDERPAKDNRFPHACPKCQGPAYIGFSSVECKGGCQ